MSSSNNDTTNDTYSNTNNISNDRLTTFHSKHIVGVDYRYYIVIQVIDSIIKH